MSSPKSIASKLITPLLIILCIISVILLKVGSIFILLALIPSIVAYYLDQSDTLNTFKTVLSCNLAAISPAIYPMVKAAYMFEPFNAYALLSDPMNWLIAYTGAAAGWALIFLCRFIARLMVIVAYEYQIHGLRQMQKSLIEEWGKDIQLTSIPPEQE